MSRLDSLLELHKKEPDDSFVLYGIALEYISENNLSEAEKYLKELLANDPDYVPGYMQYAMLKEKQDEIEKAKEIYQKGIEVARRQGDNKAANEMEDFLDELE